MESQSLTSVGTYYEERHPVDEALGCIIPAAIVSLLGLLGILNLPKLFL